MLASHDLLCNILSFLPITDKIASCIRVNKAWHAAVTSSAAHHELGADIHPTWLRKEQEDIARACSYAGAQLRKLTLSGLKYYLYDEDPGTLVDVLLRCPAIETVEGIPDCMDLEIMAGLLPKAKSLSFSLVYLAYLHDPCKVVDQLAHRLTRLQVDIPFDNEMIGYLLANAPNVSHLGLYGNSGQAALRVLGADASCCSHLTALHVTLGDSSGCELESFLETRGAQLQCLSVEFWHVSSTPTSSAAFMELLPSHCHSLRVLLLHGPLRNASNRLGLWRLPELAAAVKPIGPNLEVFAVSDVHKEGFAADALRMLLDNLPNVRHLKMHNLPELTEDCLDAFVASSCYCTLWCLHLSFYQPIGLGHRDKMDLAVQRSFGTECTDVLVYGRDLRLLHIVKPKLNMCPHTITGISRPPSCVRDMNKVPRCELERRPFHVYE